MRRVHHQNRFLPLIFALISFLMLVTALLLLLLRTAVAAGSLDVVISEIAWIGTTTSSTDEWLELRNNMATAIGLTGWQLTTSDGTPTIALIGSIPANGYFLLERTDDGSTPELADLFYTGALLNTGEVLTLTDALNVVVDVANGPDDWFAGDNTTKETMERIAPQASWGNGPVDGTPTNSIQDADGDTFAYLRFDCAKMGAI